MFLIYRGVFHRLCLRVIFFILDNFWLTSQLIFVNWPVFFEFLAKTIQPIEREILLL